MSDNNGSSAFQMAETSQEFNLKEFIFKYLRHWPLLAACIFVALILAFVKVRYATPIYSVTGSLFINKENKNSSGNDARENMFMVPSNLNLKKELQILKS